MYKSISSLCLLLVAILLGCALANAQEVSAASSVSLHIFGSSSVWWLAVQPRNDNGQTSKVEVKDSSSSTYTTLVANKDWGYYSASAPSGNGFKAPLTVRLTSASGATVSVQVSGIVPESVIDIGASFGGVSATQKPSTPSTAPTTRATSAPTQKASTPSTSAPTQKSTTAPTQKATTAPTQKATVAPTQKATAAPTQKATTPSTAPTTRATSAPATGGNLCSVTAESSEPLKIMVPLYTYPGASWDALIAAAGKVKILAIINPNSGPIATVDSAYSSYMTKLKNAGIEMVGYVYTSYGLRDVNAVKADIDTYVSKYPLLSGIFLDEASNSAAQLPFYTTVYNYIMAKPGYQHSILNPGTQPDEGYLAVSTNIMIYENYGTSLASTSLSSWVTCATSAGQKADYKYRFSGVAHTAPASTVASYVQNFANKGFGYVYVTDGAGGCCTYNSLTTYFSQLAAAVEAVNN